MNKFSKTSYPRHITQNNFLSSGQQDRQKKKTNQQSQVQKKKGKLHDFDHAQPLHTLVDKKIEIDPTLLFNGKINSRTGKPVNQLQKINTSANRQMYSTSHDGFYKNNKQRPQSKQQSRVKAIQNLSLSKRKQDLGQRPQTSKGQRNVIYGTQIRKKTVNEDHQQQVQISRTAKTAVGSRRRNTAKQLELQTSIDPEFLALFAS